VPSRLQGEVLNIRIYDDRLVCYLGSVHVETLPRLHFTNCNKRKKQVNYRHVIHSLVKKPQAFRYSQLRNELLPDANYRTIWLAVDKIMSAKEACKFIVGLLYLAAICDCEKALGERVVADLSCGRKLSLGCLQQQFGKEDVHNEVQVKQHSLERYDRLITEQLQAEVCHA
jgi:hypothetical protein